MKRPTIVFLAALAPAALAACGKALPPPAPPVEWSAAPASAPTYVEKHVPTAARWYAADDSNTHCSASQSPAEKIRELKADGLDARPHDWATEVRVTVDDGLHPTDLWKFYRTEDACTATLGNNSKYE